MNFKKMISTIAATALATSALAVSAGATLVVPDNPNPANETSVGTGQMMVKLYVDGSVELACDVTAIDTIRVRVSPTESDRDLFEGQIGGSISTSCGPASACPSDHNWIMNAFWGLSDPELGIECIDDSNPVIFKKVGDYTYEAECKMTADNCFYQEAVDAEGGYVQISFQEWGNDMADIELLSIVCEDKNGNVLVAYDGAGYPISTGATAAPAPAPAADDAAPAPAPAAGDVAAATDSSKGSPDTGVADVAAVAGLAIVAAGAVIVSQKRK